MNNEITIALLDEQTMEQQADVYRTAFGLKSSSLDILNKWRKKHYENPLGKSLIFGASVGDQMVSIKAYVPVEYYIDGNKVPMLLSCESGVIPEYRRKGIWSKLVSYALDYIHNETNYKLILSFPNYRNSYKGFQKMGWKTVDTLNNYVLLNNLSTFKKTFSGNNILRRAVLNIFGLQRILICLNLQKKYTVEETSVENLLWDEYDKNVVTCNHSVELLKWKQDYKNLQSVCVKQGDNVVATCLYGLGSYNGGKIIKIESFKCNKGYEKEARNILISILKYFKQAHPEVSFIRIWTQNNSSLNSILKKVLFIKSPHPNPFLVNDPQSKYAELPWTLSFFDLDY